MDSFLKKSKSKKIKKAYSEYANGNLDQALALIEDEIKHKDGNVVDDAWVLLGKISFDRQDYNSNGTTLRARSEQKRTLAQ
ncbi:hypothetical protein Psal006b_02074 [Piscirickettsia salmonis]|uniref:Methyltransferase domain protein n=1 Tax=Piscirickettsia salmonis TaxID=1238 RepID=A0A1L6TAR7_PISSA|nr:hypothetical protein [Piscirickettsia salmonis]AKP73561.1 hypothetical protein PSLF89_1716 [Piscirickettsia salmonis LF-89 = ATCC VR-1361]ALB22318.1 methyltransferase domain protein [Piscirickettsia salmonis]ALY02407.1 hypothetical protein AWE47_05685 [Piscirickettsia salmonis]AMA41924.1 hypothetical protein AWJ11_05685 [Piscirickettsia salmonis]AOS34400.1 hypothetical protein AVM72_02905 [Piscirickettsia salmonis]